jgi:hypothetical protein
VQKVELWTLQLSSQCVCIVLNSVDEGFTSVIRSEWPEKMLQGRSLCTYTVTNVCDTARFWLLNVYRENKNLSSAKIFYNQPSYILVESSSVTKATNYRLQFWGVIYGRFADSLFQPRPELFRPPTPPSCVLRTREQLSRCYSNQNVKVSAHLSRAASSTLPQAFMSQCSRLRQTFLFYLLKNDSEVAQKHSALPVSAL